MEKSIEISYTLKEEDLIDLARFQLDQADGVSKAIRQRRFLYTTGFGLMAIGSWFVFGTAILPLVFGSLAVLSFLFVPLAMRRAVERRLPRFVKSMLRETSLGTWSLSAQEDGLVQRGTDTESLAAWNLVDGLSENDNYIYISVDGIYSVVIPKVEVEPNKMTSFTAAVQSRLYPNAT